MSSAMQKLRSLLPSGSSSNSQSSHLTGPDQRPSESLQPEIGFQISIESSQGSASNGDINAASTDSANFQQRGVVPELNVHLLAARHLPALFGFKIVQGYLVKVKLFPGSKRLDSSIQSNSWPKFNENFRFPLGPDIKSALKHSSRRGSKLSSDFNPEEIFAGQFVVFTVYALLELPPASFNRFNKTYRSLRDKSTNFVQKVVESSSGKSNKEEKENSTASETQKTKRKASEANPRDSMPPLTISESRRNIGSVTCYLEPKIFKRNPRTGVYSTDELWLPIKDITTTVVKGPCNNVATAAKGVIELALEIKDLSLCADSETNCYIDQRTPPNTPTTPTTPAALIPSPPNVTNGSGSGVAKNPQWNRMTSEVKRKMGISNVSKPHKQQPHNLVLNITTSRMRCAHKVKDELENAAGSVYVKTTVFEHGIYIDSWKSPNFYPSLSTKFDAGADAAMLTVPLQNLDSLENIHVRTTLATKTKMGKKLVLGTVLLGAGVTAGSGAEHMQLLRDTLVNERVPMWHSFQ